MHRKHPIELRVPSKPERPLSDLSSFPSTARTEVLSPEISPKTADSYMPMSQKHDQDSVQALVNTLKSDKQALKDALRTAIGKRDELSLRLQSVQSSVSQEAKKTQMCEMELTHAQQVIAHLSRELEERSAKIEQMTGDRDMLLRENEALKMELSQLRHHPDPKRSTKHVRTASEVASLKPSDTLHEIGKYGNFIVAKLGQVPELQALFRGRAYNTRYFQDIIQKGAFAEGFLTMLQFISDILVFETHKRSANCSPKAMDGGSFAFQTSRISSRHQSVDIDSSSQQSSDSSSKPPPIPSIAKITAPQRTDSPLFLLAKNAPRKFTKESRSAGNSPKRGVTSRQKEPVTPSLGKKSAQKTSTATKAGKAS